MIKKEPNWSTDVPKFCTYCGGLMLGKPIKVNDFDPHTGKPVNRKEYYLGCEKINWVGRWIGTMHDEKHVIEEPDRKIGNYSYRGVLTIMRRP